MDKCPNCGSARPFLTRRNTAPDGGNIVTYGCCDRSAMREAVGTPPPAPDPTAMLRRAAAKHFSYAAIEATVGLAPGTIAVGKKNGFSRKQARKLAFAVRKLADGGK